MTNDRAWAAGILGIPVDASPEEGRRAFRRRIAAVHPDRRPHDAAAAEEARRLSQALALFEQPEPPAPAPPPPSRATRIVNLRLSGPAAWRGGSMLVDYGGFGGVVRVPPGVNVGDVLPVELDRGGGRAPAIVVEVDYSPWRRDGLDLRGELEVSLYDVITEAEITTPTPWGDVAVRLPGQPHAPLRPLRLRGRGIRSAKGEAGSLILDLRVALPPDDALVRAALRGHRREPRLV
ncbi:DnaJ C-terminal domain-containing protein [Nannocystis bainbridge]|uniref:DnaJ C-terminal domain-containing protein n=1 Tax=Nannocystis bainbridge TaxID=2995303 RepID=A0ABT5E476_9BACT|nr:DnaJ C-terminal domain-containing protein [Nannocystis bainbridge]MDC0720667.1 DnaJ C-terminal domain-containing protein [Nannocystis bainbridge]